MIAILDFGAGNITSVKNLLYHLNVEPIITSKSDDLLQVDKVIFPGVGHADFAMNQLFELQLVEFIKSYDKPFLGICLGFQLLCEFSEEGNTHCLGILPAKVKKFPDLDVVPHVGWNEIYHNNHLIFKDIPQNSDFYFVHSYYIEVNPYCIAKTNYILEFCAVANRNNFYGVQFHPEKSADLGKIILKNFLNL